MTDFPNKVVSILLVFVMLVIAPLLWNYSRDIMKMERAALNESELFLDKVTDKAIITDNDIDDFYIGLNATGGTYDVQVKRYISTSIPDDAGEVRTKYVSVPYKEKGTGKASLLNKGDIVKVEIKEVGSSPAKRMMWAILRIEDKKGDFSLAKAVD